MNYYRNFLKYVELLNNFNGDTFEEAISEVKKVSISKKDGPGKAFVMFGFSGNGKSTWIEGFIKENPDYEVLSIDAVTKELFDAFGNCVNGMDITKAFSKKIDEVCSRGNNVILDGNFLNLFTRSAVTDALHEYGYEVTLVDITPIFDVTFEQRIIDEASNALGVLITKDNVNEYKNYPLFQQVEKKVRDFHEDEKERASFEAQMLAGGMSVGVDKIITVSSCSTNNYGSKWQK